MIILLLYNLKVARESISSIFFNSPFIIIILLTITVLHILSSVLLRVAYCIVWKSVSSACRLNVYKMRVLLSNLTIKSLISWNCLVYVILYEEKKLFMHNILCTNACNFFNRSEPITVAFSIPPRLFTRDRDFFIHVQR